MQQCVQQAAGNAGYLGANGDTHIVGFNGDGRVQGLSELGLSFQRTDVQRPGQAQVLVQIFVGVILLSNLAGGPGIAAVVQGQGVVVGNCHVVGELRIGGLAGYAGNELARSFGSGDDRGTSSSSGKAHLLANGGVVAGGLGITQSAERSLLTSDTAAT